VLYLRHFIIVNVEIITAHSFLSPLLLHFPLISSIYTTVGLQAAAFENSPHPRTDSSTNLGMKKATSLLFVLALFNRLLSIIEVM
jgi:hypothetical protein